jgi:hypothetical protein
MPSQCSASTLQVDVHSIQPARVSPVSTLIYELCVQKEDSLLKQGV